MRAFFALFLLASLASAETRPNVLMIFVDDLRPALGCYGDPLARTPHIDRFAATARVFTRAYCHQAVCGPSRAAILTGRLPDNTGVWHNRNLFRNKHPELVTLPQLFKDNGWRALSLGKVFSGDERELDPKSWSEPEVLKQKGWTNYLERSGAGKGKAAPFEMADVADDGYPDGKLANLAVETLTTLKSKPQPFFLAVGFFKPHLPFNAPKRYWDLHDAEKFAQPGVARARGAPEAAYPDHLELAGYRGVPADERVDAAQAKKLRHGYYACVSYVDAQIGKVLDALPRLGLESNTVIVLLGDHGYSLGEADHWCKDTNFEMDTRVPLIVRTPGLAKPGAPTGALTEYVDLYPTLAGLAGLTPPADVDGRTLKGPLDDPAAKGRDCALSQFSRPFRAGDPTVMGHSLRTETHRYTRWTEWAGGKVLAEELYDYATGPSTSAAGPFPVERINLAGDPAHAAVQAELKSRLELLLTERTGRR